MIRDFTKDDVEEARGGRDTEITLEGGTLFIVGCALLILCAVSFTIGYFVGRSGSEPSTAASSTSAGQKTLSIPTGSGTKPGAAGQQPRPQTVAGVDVPAGPTTASSATDAQNAVPAGNTGSQQNQLKQSADAQVQPATTQVQGWMVQIAAVSHSEDAEVLVNALRKRGYAVVARREVNDNLIHVQTGPFATRNDANAMRQKLLNDGYNADVE